MARKTLLLNLILALAAALAPGARPAAAVAAAQAPADSAAQAQARAISALVRAGDWEQALPLCRRYVREHPADQRMLYNLACLQNRAGDADQAAAALKQALAAGFAEMALAMQDPDLEGVADRPQLGDLDPQTARELAQRAAAGAIALQAGAWSAAIPLAGAEPGPVAEGPVLRLRWQPAGLELELTLPAQWAGLASAQAPPWQDGPGVAAVLGVPEDGDSCLTGNTFSFAFGVQEGRAVGALYLTGPDRWQQVAQMDPKLKPTDGAGVVLTGILPWQAIMPYHPLVDDTLRLNVVVRLGLQPGSARAGLLPDPWAFVPQAARHRTVALTFRAETAASDLLAGKVSSSLSRQEPVTVTLVATSGGGRGSLTLDVVDERGRSLQPGGSQVQAVDLPPGRWTWTQPVDFRGLPSGAYLVRARLTLPSGREAVWSTTVLHLAPDWEPAFAGRIDRLPPGERATARLHLDALSAAVATHRDRRNPGPLSTTLQDLGRMLARADTTGSLLPAQGTCTFVYPGPDGGPVRCSLYLPPGDGAQLLPVLVLHSAPGRGDQVVQRIARRCEFGPADSLLAASGARRPVYVVAQGAAAAAGTDSSAAQAQALLDWALQYFQAPRALVAGIDAGGAAALELVRSRPAALAGLLVMAGRDFDPWPRAEQAALASPAPPPPAGTPLTWIDFPQETAATGRASAVLQALKARGWRVDREQSVPGGLSLSQAADRLVMWTGESLRAR